MGRGVVFVPRALCGAFVAVVVGVVAVRPTILRRFIALDVVGDVLADELASVGAPCWLVAPAVPVLVVVAATALAAPVAIFVTAGWAVVAAAVTVAPRSSPVSVAIVASPLPAAVFDSAGC